MTYRPEIDGLRALAILPVLFFHSSISFMPGGFVGVDIFFVISGFLISSIIFAEINKGSFSFYNFWLRRVRRLLPASMAMVLTFIPLFAFIFPPHIFEDFFNSAIANTFFASNIWFWRDNPGGYFNPEVELKPLLHTWSLSVEEQFYFLFPFLAFVIGKSNRLRLIIFLSLTFVSLLLSIYLTPAFGVASFYLLPTRGWELGLGVLLAIILKKIRLNSFSGALISLFGLALITYSIFFFDDETIFPYYNALYPCLGTVFLILGFSNNENAIKTFFSNFVFVFIGKISYSLYLWHWPIFIFFFWIFPEKPLSISFLAIILSFLISFLSYRFIENPLRNKDKFPTKKILYLVILLTLLILGISSIGKLKDGFPERYIFSENTVPNFGKSSPMRLKCHTEGPNYLNPIESCVYFDEDVNLSVFGDSHSVEVAYTLAENLLLISQGGLNHLTISGCPPAHDFLKIIKPIATNTFCHSWIIESLDHILKSKSQTIIINFRHNGYLKGVDIEKDFSQEDLTIIDKDSNILRGDSAFNLYKSSFLSLINVLRKNGKRIVLIEPFPELDLPINEIAFPKSIFSTKMPEIYIEKEDYLKRSNLTFQIIEEIKKNVEVDVIKISDIFCDNKLCKLKIDGNLLYFDDNHLSLYGADIVSKKILNELIAK